MSTNRQSAQPVRAPKPRPSGKSKSDSGTWSSRLTPARTLALVAVVGAVVAGVLIGVSVLGSSSSKRSTTSIGGASEVSRLLSGVPQHGIVLGSSSAPVTLVEYADLQCPYCAEFATSTLPQLIASYVRTGKARIEFRGVAILGPESETALRSVVSAARQDRLWNMVELLYLNQGAENSGWVNDDLLRATGAKVSGLDVSKMLADRSSSSTDAAIKVAAQQATNLMGSRIQTPTFEVGRSGSPLQHLSVSSLDVSAFTPAIDALLAR